MALTAADLRAANVDVAMVGAGLDFSGGMRGAGYGPRALRANDMYLPNVAAGLPHGHVRVDALEELVICDYGDAPVDFESTHRSIEPIRAVVREIAEAAEGTDHLFISLDIDVLDPAYAPGTGTPEPNGLTPRELFPLLRRLGAETNVVGVELVELNPLVDPTYVTPLVANRCAREILTGMAMRRVGITDPWYLAPDALATGTADRADGCIRPDPAAARLRAEPARPVLVTRRASAMIGR